MRDLGRGSVPLISNRLFVVLCGNSLRRSIRILVHGFRTFTRRLCFLEERRPLSTNRPTARKRSAMKRPCRMCTGWWSHISKDCLGTIVRFVRFCVTFANFVHFPLAKGQGTTNSVGTCRARHPEDAPYLYTLHSDLETDACLKSRVSLELVSCGSHMHRTCSSSGSSDS